MVSVVLPLELCAQNVTDAVLGFRWNRRTT